MMHCLLASLTEQYFNKISNDHKTYTEDDVELAALLFKLLMRTSIVVTRARIYQLCSSRNDLDNYMGTVNSNIELFDLHVRDAHEGLLSRGQTVDNLVMKIFKGYKAASDNNFVDYITKKEENYLEGTEYDSNELMQLSLNKYTTRKESSEWVHPLENKSKLQLYRLNLVE